ncbi:Chromatin structure-remodeling complex subunit RSC7 [Vanrija pseudolonga]|uniref:Chromatin structure-remodeling complex subunit RSC7 n=1 Tax=Vanrija pseudolonga TaxID=143232 RepID=A0AAF0Y8W8_9TREE|nr:Chromatin structure-remodeling complex subunit RSC7 [Vanrija pseudolonga]
MPPRPRRSQGAAQNSPAKRSRAPRKSAVKDEPDTPDPELHDDGDDDAVGEDAEDDDDEEEPAPKPGPSRSRSRAKPRSSNAKRTPKRAKTEEEATEDDDDEEVVSAGRRRSGKQVSYKEIPAGADDKDEESDGDDDDDDEEEEEKPVKATPARRNNRRAKEDKDDKPYKREPGTGGRGGFSVKGAAAAAARARWDKVRREKAERGEDSDEAVARRRTNAPIKKDPRGALENVINGQKYTIKNAEYVAGDDELIIPDDPKGDTKVDAEGRLLGGREYKLVTFTSATRKNKERVYALTIDAARACGYTDSLAFLRRCPQIVKLSCDPDERQMLIDIGRITGNLKHRMVTMVAMRNVFKLMGARLVKGGKWVDDDYNEEQALIDCGTNGWTPHSEVLDEELAVNQYPSAGGPGRPPANAGFLADGVAAKSALTPFYTVGGPTTHFGGTGADPWSDTVHGRRGKLRGLGVTEEDWMLRTAEESRRIDETLRGYRDERIEVLSGQDTRGWVHYSEEFSSGAIKPEVDEHKHPLANELTFDTGSEPLTPAPPEPAAPAADNKPEASEDKPVVDKVPGGKIVVERESETRDGRPKKSKWQPGVVRAAYEPHTQLPHVPLRTQPSSAEIKRVSHLPLVGLNGSARYVKAPGIASVEFVYTSGSEDAGTPAWLTFGDAIQGADAIKKRKALIAEAEEWERVSRAKRRA